MIQKTSFIDQQYECCGESKRSTDRTSSQGVRLVAVSKFHPNEAIEEAYQAGQRIFGESKVQEMTAKHETFAEGHRMAFHRALADEQDQIHGSPT